MSPVTLCSHGAARTVTGSRHLIQAGSSRVLLDCGLFQGHRSEANERNRHVAIECDAVVLSHAHLDHSGALPGLVRNGYRGPIHATAATLDLCRALLADAASIAESDARYLNKKRRPKQRPIEPMYTSEDVERTLKLFVPHRYGKSFEAARGVRATFRDAGHILGSAGILLEVDSGPAIYFTGDLGRRMYPILQDPEPLPDVDVVLSESTYGDRDHQDAKLAEEQLCQEIARCAASKGKLFIPAFSVGRTQNIIYSLAQHWKAGTIPKIDVFVDSPLARKATEVFADHPECWDREVEEFFSEGGRPFYPKGVRYVETVNESKELNNRGGPCVIIAGSGMCEGGRILHHLKHGLENEDNTVLFVGWSAPNTLGRRIMEGHPHVRIYGKDVKVRARVEQISAYSAHADRSDLIRFLDPAREMGAAIFLIHGEEDAALSLRETLMAKGHREVTVPETYAIHPLPQRVHASG